MWTFLGTFTLIDIFVFLYLILLSAIDIRKQTLPSILTTSGIFLVAIANFQNLPYGILAFIFGWILMDGFADKGEFFSGVADLKMMVLLGLMTSTLGMFLVTCVLVVIFGTLYKVFAVKVFKQKEVTAFIPVFLLTFITLMIIKYVVGGI
jgi:hypothetical protein